MLHGGLTQRTPPRSQSQPDLQDTSRSVATPVNPNKRLRAHGTPTELSSDLGEGPNSHKDLDVPTMLMKLLQGQADERVRLTEVKSLLENLSEDVIQIKAKQLDYENQLGAHDLLIQELKQEIDVQRKELIDMKREISRMPPPETVRDIRERQQRIEDERRSQNLVIHGLERGRTTGVQAAEQFFVEQLNIQPPFEDAMWLGRGDTAPLRVKLRNIRDKIKIMKHLNKLRGTNISVRDDLSYETRQERRRQLETFKQLRRDGQKPEFRGPVLYVKGQPYDGTTTAASSDGSALDGHGRGGQNGSAHGRGRGRSNGSTSGLGHGGSNGSSSGRGRGGSIGITQARGRGWESCSLPEGHGQGRGGPDGRGEGSRMQAQ